MPAVRRGRLLDMALPPVPAFHQGPDWVRPERRAAMLTGALPRTPAEQRYQEAVWNHRIERIRAQERRG